MKAPTPNGSSRNPPALVDPPARAAPDPRITAVVGRWRAVSRRAARAERCPSTSTARTDGVSSPAATPSANTSVLDAVPPLEPTDPGNGIMITGFFAYALRRDETGRLRLRPPGRCGMLMLVALVGPGLASLISDHRRADGA